MTEIKVEVVESCKQKLLNTKEDLLNLRQSSQIQLVESERGGDEADLSTRAIDEVRNLELNERIRSQLLEIEMALHRIRDGSFGICEETGEAIESERLLAIPWTRLSIEGAELRESINKRYIKF